MWLQMIQKVSPPSQHSSKPCSNWAGATDATYDLTSAGARMMLTAIANLRPNWSLSHGASGRYLYWQHTQGCQARRPSGPAIDQVRIRHQSPDCAFAKSRYPADAPRPRRRGDRMRRREFIMLAGAAALSSEAASAQNPGGVRRIGVLLSLAETDPEGKAQFSGFTQGLAELGWVEGRNLKMEVRWGRGDIDRIRTFAKDLVALQPDVIL